MTRVVALALLVLALAPAAAQARTPVAPVEAEATLRHDFADIFGGYPGAIRCRVGLRRGWTSCHVSVAHAPDWHVWLGDVEHGARAGQTDVVLTQLGGQS